MLKSILKSPKTSLIASVGAIAGFLKAFHIYDMTPEQMSALALLLAVIIGYLSKDADRGASSDKTNGSK